MQSSPEGTNRPPHTIEIGNDHQVYLDSVESTNKFISTFLQPAIEKRYGHLPRERHEAHQRVANQGSEFSFFEMYHERGADKRSRTEYIISAVKFERCDFEDGLQWRQFVAAINSHPEAEDYIQTLLDDDEAQGFIPLDSQPDQHDVTVVTTREFGFRYGWRVRNGIKHAFLVDGAEFTFPEPQRDMPVIRKGMSQDDRYLTSKEWEIAAALSSTEMRILLEALETLDLRQPRR